MACQWRMAKAPKPVHTAKTPPETSFFDIFFNALSNNAAHDSDAKDGV
jgi:hypothetical protein